MEKYEIYIKGEKIAELERFYRLNNTILKFMTMRINEEDI